jgi:hypothetical protein
VLIWWSVPADIPFKHVKGARAEVQPGLDALRLRQDAAQRRLLPDPPSNESDFVADRGVFGHDEPPIPIAEGDLEILLIPHPPGPFRACASVSRARCMRSPASCTLPVGSRNRTRTRQQGHSTAAWAATCTHCAQIAYPQRGHGNSMSVPSRSLVTDPATGLPSSPAAKIANQVRSGPVQGARGLQISLQASSRRPFLCSRKGLWPW